MHEVPTVAQATTALACWQAFAAEGTKIMTEEAALRAKYEQLYPLRLFTNSRQPNPVRFYGPGPDGRLHPHDPPVGTLHYARWRHEIAAVGDAEGDGCHDEQNPSMIKRQRNRPTYTTKGNRTAREVNYSLWEKVTADSINDMSTHPGPKTIRAIHEEYLLNEDDFNDTDDQKAKVMPALNNRQDEDPKNIYPLGYQLLKQWSKANGHAEWQEGECLGPDPHNPDALTKHLGWFPNRLRMTKAGLGADAQDFVWNEVFHGNLDAKPKEKFIPPKAKWSEDPHKVTVLANSGNNCTTLKIVSREALKDSLPLPGSDTLNARKIWLDAQGVKRPVYSVTKAVPSSQLAINKSTVPFLSKMEAMTDMKLVTMSGYAEGEEPEAKSTKESEVTEIQEQEKSLGITQKPAANNMGGKDANRKLDTTTPDPTLNEEHEAIEAKLKELSINTERGREGKRPIVIYSAFRSKLLGTPVTQVLGYEE
ncbi:hypothetical protein F4803DRAFT_555244 [Xylaria telfairii]|nr:hypothetical protein F4803DRAFT_555244 [Xylaria telfairii]